MFLIRSWKVLKMFSIKSWSFGIKIFWLLPYIGFFPSSVRPRKQSKYRQRQEGILFLLILDPYMLLYFFCKWIMKKNTKFLDAGHVTNSCTPMLSFFLFSQSLCLCFPFWIQDLRYTVRWFLVVGILVTFLCPSMRSSLIRHSQEAFILSKMMTDWT